MSNKEIKLSDHWADGKFYGFRKFIHGHHFSLGNDRALACDKVEWILKYKSRRHQPSSPWSAGDITFIQNVLSIMRRRSAEEIEADRQDDLDEIGLERPGKKHEIEKLKAMEPSQFMSTAPAYSTTIPTTQPQTVTELLVVEQAAKRFVAELRRRQQAGVVSKSHVRSQEYRLKAGLEPIKALPFPQVGQNELSAVVLRLVQRPMIGKGGGKIDSDGGEFSTRMFTQSANLKPLRR